jgi:hypothetical protein
MNLAPLPVRLKPYEDESLISFIKRLGLNNGMYETRPLIQILGASVDKLETMATEPFRLKRLATFSGIDKLTLEAMSYWPQEKRASFRGQPINREFLCIRHRRICPQCLRQAPYHRAIWDVAVFTHCILHGTKLLTRCPSCRSHLTWPTVSLTKCRCGQELSRLVLPRVARKKLGAVAAVQQALFAIAPCPIAALSPGDYLALVFKIGWYASGRTARPRPIKLAFGRQSLLPYLERGVQACQDWPHSFHALLDGVAKRAKSRPGRYGFIKQFGSLGDWALREHGALGVLLRRAFSVYLAANAILRIRTKRVSKPASSAAITLADAQRILDLPRYRVKAALVAMSAILSSDDRGKGAPVMVDTAAATRLLAELDALASRDQSRRMLGVSRKQMEYLLKGALPLAANNFAAGLLPYAVWTRQDLKDWVSRLCSHSGKIEGTTIPFPKAINLAIARGLDTSKFMTGVRSGRLRTQRRPAAPGLWAIEVSLNDLESLAPANAKSGYSIEEVARRLGVHRQVAYGLVNRGLLRPTGPRRARGRRIAEAALMEFRASYVIASELKVGEGYHKGWVADQLVKAGATPVFGPSVGGRQFIFRRSDVIRTARDAAGATAMPNDLRGAIQKLAGGTNGTPRTRRRGRICRIQQTD